MIQITMIMISLIITDNDNENDNDGNNCNNKIIKIIIMMITGREVHNKIIVLNIMFITTQATNLTSVTTRQRLLTLYVYHRGCELNVSIMR